jgi:hypothetical protein
MSHSLTAKATVNLYDIIIESLKEFNIAGCFSLTVIQFVARLYERRSQL